MITKIWGHPLHFCAPGECLTCLNVVPVLNLLQDQGSAEPWGSPAKDRSLRTLDLSLIRDQRWHEFGPSWKKEKLKILKWVPDSQLSSIFPKPRNELLPQCPGSHFPFSLLGSLDQRQDQCHTSSIISSENNGVPEHSLGDSLSDETSKRQEPHIIVVYTSGSPWVLGKRARISKEELQGGCDQGSRPTPSPALH